MAVNDIHVATASDFQEVLEWLKEERDRGEDGFFCNREIIAKSFGAGEGLCTICEGKIVGFAVFQFFIDSGDVQIIEVHQSFRRKGLGAKLLGAAVGALCGLGAMYIDVECTSREGEALCRSYGFEEFFDPQNFRGEWDNPTLRLYFSDWRPSPPHPWA